MNKLIGILLVLFGSCQMTTELDLEKKDDIPSGTNLRVGPKRAPCAGVVENQSCLLVQEGNTIGSDDWNLFYGSISGFSFEEGYLYNLDVVKTSHSNAPQDGSTIDYTLVRILSKNKQ